MQLRPCHWGVTSDPQCNTLQKKANSLVCTEHLPETSASSQVSNLMNWPPHSPVIAITLQGFLRKPKLKVLRTVWFITPKCWPFAYTVWSSLTFQFDVAVKKTSTLACYILMLYVLSGLILLFSLWTCTHSEYSVEEKTSVKSWKENLGFPISPLVTVIVLSAYAVIWDPSIKLIFS